jgi:hypothetical protein
MTTGPFLRSVLLRSEVIVLLRFVPLFFFPSHFFCREFCLFPFFLDSRKGIDEASSGFKPKFSLFFQVAACHRGHAFVPQNSKGVQCFLLQVDE